VFWASMGRKIVPGALSDVLESLNPKSNAFACCDECNNAYGIT
jgi:hypothetical protein